MHKSCADLENAISIAREIFPYKYVLKLLTLHQFFEGFQQFSEHHLQNGNILQDFKFCRQNSSSVFNSRLSPVLLFYA